MTIPDQNTPNKRNFFELHLAASATTAPEKIVESTEYDMRFDLPKGFLAKKTGVERRHKFVRGQDGVVELAAVVLEKALKQAGLNIADVDHIICAGATPAQIIPANSILLHDRIGAPKSTTCVDIDMTCLSFLSALETTTALLACGMKKRVAIINSELGTSGVDPHNPAHMGLFGDAASCFIFDVESSPNVRISKVKVDVHSTQNKLCRLVGGGSVLPGFEFSKENRADQYFHMEGPALYKFAMENIPGFIATFLDEIGLEKSQFSYLLPHQASAKAISLVCRKLGFKRKQVVSIIENYGNCISASIPVALSLLISGDSNCPALNKNEPVLMLATGAGVTLGTFTFEMI